MKVKICGITCVEDARCISAMGVDAIGLVFHPPSSRCVTLSQASEIVTAIPPFVSKVGLFVNHEQAFIEHAVDTLGLDWIQLHGDELPAFAKTLSRPILRALRVALNTDVTAAAALWQGIAQGILLDHYDPTLYGGSGSTFDWRLVPEQLGMPLVLAGGLNVDNIAQAINRVKPWAVDVSSGVESAPGKKDLAKVQQFIEQARNAF